MNIARPRELLSGSGVRPSGKVAAEAAGSVQNSTATIVPA
jgi:hypothetical protein